MNYQWYPGHMTKARRMMQEDIKLIDLIIELVDARIPLSSRNPDIDELGKNKARLILLNKSDLADEKYNDRWNEYFRARGFLVLKVNSQKGTGLKAVNGAVLEACREKIERDRRRGIKNRPVRAMVVGIPNVGKSTFINSFAGKACTKTGNRPGVTKGKQWIRLNKNVELLDTPGILWPKFEDQSVGLKLAMIGSIRDEILNVDELALELLAVIRENYPGLIEKRFETEETGKPVEVMERIGQKRQCLLKGGQLDYTKTARLILDEFRSGKIGKITLEYPKEEVTDDSK
ncbi:MAG: ribosome biogenesis GTPase YlqF [Ruminococcus sp.]|jgi:ribosome biogenesis GTPase A